MNIMKPKALLLSLKFWSSRISRKSFLGALIKDQKSLRIILDSVTKVYVLAKNFAAISA